jgi:predicted RNA binding protein YcfA (HicA-like mRNA interferase family)
MHFIKYMAARMNGKQIIKLLQAQGCTVLRVTGSQPILGNGSVKVTLPVQGAADVKLCTFKRIENKQE